jgi:superfamily II DNA or RNA helicase
LPLRSSRSVDAPGANTFERWEPGDRLTLRGEQWTVAGLTSFADCQALRVDADGDRPSRTFLLPFDRPQRIRQDRLAIVSPRSWFHRFAKLLEDSHPYGALRFCPGSIDLLPYQLEPAMAMLRDGHPRLLIADDVGLGKTIEAGLILRELAGSQDGFRAILLVPAGLRTQWTEELHRFGLDPIFADASWLREAERSLPSDVNPWSLPGVYLCSLDFVKRPEALRPLEDMRWDLVVVDEAHAATLSTDRRAAVDAIAVRSQRVLLLTATPPGDPVQFAGLCHIGSFSGEADIPIFQRGRHREAAMTRRSAVIAVNLTEEERRMHRVVERYTQLMWRERNSEGRLVSTILRKRALSSASALERSLRRRFDLLSGIIGIPEHQLLLPLRGDEETQDDVISDESLGSWTLEDRATEERTLREAIQVAALASTSESKARVLLKLLKRVSEPAIVFTEYRDTLAWLHAWLKECGIRTCVLHGAMTSGERRASLADFRRGNVTLLATDAAAEGLNLHQGCRIVVHYELPWNPGRMLQRTGRVDRIGQTRRVHEIALVAADTAEAVVIAPFARRAATWWDARSRASLEWLTESRMAEAVFEGVQSPSKNSSSSRVARTTMNLRAEASHEARRLEAHRVLLSARGTSTPGGEIPCAILRKSSLSPGLVLVFELRVLHAREILVRAIVILQCSLAVRLWPRKLSQLRGRISDVLSQVLPVVVPRATRLGTEHAESIRELVNRASARTRTRARLLHQMHESAARQLVQFGLFERRRSGATFIDHTTTPFDPTGHQPKSTEDATGVTSSADLCALLLIPPR